MSDLIGNPKDRFSRDAAQFQGLWHTGNSVSFVILHVISRALERLSESFSKAMNYNKHSNSLYHKIRHTNASAEKVTNFKRQITK